MTDTTNGWPDKPGVPLNPERDGGHILQFPNSEKRTWLWRASPELGPLWVSCVNNGLTPDKVASLHATYLGPVLTPDEVAALQARVAELEAAIYQYVKHVVSYEGISFIDEMNWPLWAKLINDTWEKQAALEGKKA